MTRVINAFQSVRPRGAVAPSAVPRPHNVGKAPGLLPGSAAPLALDSNGKRCVPLMPRMNGAFAIESGAVARASVDKRHALVKGGI